jgi:hypothetical protein
MDDSAESLQSGDWQTSALAGITIVHLGENILLTFTCPGVTPFFDDAVA